MRLIAAAIMAMASLTATVSAQEQAADREDLASWATAMPTAINGVKIYPMAQEEGRITMSDLVELPSVSRDVIYVNVLADVRRRFDSDLEEMDNLDIAGRRLLLRRSVADESTSATYNYSVALQMADEMLSFLIYDISIGYREKGIVPRTLDIEKMRPADNRRHKELVEGFALHASKYVHRLVHAVAQGEAEPVSHWDEIASGRVVKGMNPTEVLLAKGRPGSERVTGKRTKWMYGNENVVVFTDGVVSTVI